MLDVIPIPSGCPMTTMRNGRRYLATIGRGEAISLQGDKSDVKLEIQEGCPKRAYLMEVRTDLTNFKSIIPVEKFILPDDECFISPIVEVLAPAETNTSSYTLRIPHCLGEDDDRTKVKVRMIHENRNPAVVEVPKGNVGPLYYDIDARYIELHTTHFTKVICTICQTPYHCLNTAANYWFAKFDSDHKKPDSILHDVEIRPYFGDVLHTIVDFRKVIYFQVKNMFLPVIGCMMSTTKFIFFLTFLKQDVEENINLRYVTMGHLSISRQRYNLNSGKIELSLQLGDPEWQPRLGPAGRKKWDVTSRTFTEVSFVTETNL